MAGIDLPPAFVSDVNLPLSAADLNMLRDAAIQLDGWSFRRMNACCSSGPQTTGDAADWHSRGDYRQSWWGLRLRTGMTTLTIEGVFSFYQLDFYLNGVLNSSQAAGGAFTKNITLGAFTDGDVLLLEIRTHGNPATAPGGYTPKYMIYDVYVGPIVVTSSWPGSPSFAGTYSATLLNQLRTDAQNLYDRINAVPIAPLNAMTNIPATHKVETIRLFAGSVGRYESSEYLRVVGNLYCQNTTEHYEIYYNGSLVFTSSNYTVGQTAVISVPVSLSHTLGTRAEVLIQAVVTATPALNPPQNYSVYNIIVIRSEASGSGYPVAAPPTVFTAEESITAATLNSRLNAIATMLSTVKTRLDTRTDQWNRARACRRVYAKDDTQVARNMKRHCCLFQRQGDVLVVRGKGVKIGYGAIAIEVPGENQAVNYSKYSFANEQSIGADDKVTTSTVYLDSLPGLYPGMLYYVFGNPVLEGAWEFLS